MKRFILPIVFVLLGCLLFVTYRAVDSYMSRGVPAGEWGTGLVGCESREVDSSAPCTKGVYRYDGPWLLRGAISIGFLSGVILVPSGFAIGIYRLATIKRVTPIKPTKPKK